ncbi:small integral membrane protein 20 [Amyelois transitella]|uniref:small integral membrane protein 20 n=1 Tax=Amyelois transitella TaxID=680683 RepID=UPI00067A8894|nr:small integral membrane protein 20 [Amyelois transitella]
MSFSKNGRFIALVSGLIGFIGLTMYPIAISPMIDSSEYKKIQKELRKNIDQEKIQPGNMPVWSDPFSRKKSET